MSTEMTAVHPEDVACRWDLVASNVALPAMSEESIALVRGIESKLGGETQPRIKTCHLLHGGMYFRTIHLEQGEIITGALIKVPTTLTINGHVTAYIGDSALDLCGYRVIAASAGRKQIFVAHAPTDMTMAFATRASTVAEAEDEFTDEAHLLLSRQRTDIDEVITTGE